MARLLSVSLERESGVVLARQRARQIAEQLGFSNLEQTQIATAVSEIARNAYEYAHGGVVEYAVEGKAAPQVFKIRVSDKGKGIVDVREVLSGGRTSETGMGVGIRGAQRLMDQFRIESEPGKGTVVELLKILPRSKGLLDAKAQAAVADRLAQEKPESAETELRMQNRELLMSLQDSRRQRDELAHLNQELQDTNRGVVALYAELDERAEHLRRADELKTRFLSNMSHEFRTPLNSILALSGFLLGGSDGRLTDEQIKQVGFIRKSAENLTDLVNDLLDLAKVEAGKIVIRPHEFSVHSLFGALRGMLRPLLVGDAIALIFDDADNLPLLETDESKVSQILRNFISNALKFTECGEVRISASYDNDADAVTFIVADTGIGIARTDHELIFQEFSQIENPLQHKYKGTGLGLPLSRRLAELLNGAVGLESELGKGSTFRLTIPRVYRAPAAHEDALMAERLEPNRMTVVALEDNAADLAALQTILRGTEYQLIPTRSMADAKRAAIRYQPRAILLDVMIGDDFSWGLLTEIKHIPELGEVPVIVISALEDEAKAKALGAEEFAAKPIKRDWLIDTLDRLVKGGASRRVLVIDDDEVFRYVVRQQLAGDNVRVLEAATGLQGLERAKHEQFDIIVLDLDLPDMTGFEVLSQLEREERLVSPIVVVSGMVLSAADRGRLSRAAAVVPKSEFLPGHLKQVMESHATGGAAM